MRWRSEGAAVLVLTVHLDEPEDGQPEDTEGGQLHCQRPPSDDAGVLQDGRDGDATHDRGTRQKLCEVHPRISLIRHHRRRIGAQEKYEWHWKDEVHQNC